MEIEIKNIPTHNLISAIKAFRMAFQKTDGTTYSLVESKNIVCEARDNAINGVFSLRGIRRKKYYETPLTSDIIKQYINSNYDVNFMGFGHGGCGLSGAEVINLKPTNVDLDTKGNQLFNVPNDEAGRKFLADMARYLNRNKVTYKNRGRGSRKSAGSQSFLPIDNAEWIAVYVYPKAKSQAKSF
jgi:hypothetical protein